MVFSVKPPGGWKHWSRTGGNGWPKHGVPGYAPRRSRPYSRRAWKNPPKLRNRKFSVNLFFFFLKNVGVFFYRKFSECWWMILISISRECISAVLVSQSWILFLSMLLFFFKRFQVSSNVPYDKLGGNSNVTGSQQRFGSCMLWSLQLHFIFGISQADLYKACYDPYNFIPATQAMSLRHAAAYAVFDKEEDIVKAARNLSLLVHQSFRTASSHSQPCAKHKVRGQDEIWGVCHQILSDAIRFLSDVIRYYHLPSHLLYQKTCTFRLPIVFFRFRHHDVHTPKSWSPWWWRVLRKSCLSYHPQRAKTSAGAARTPGVATRDIPRYPLFLVVGIPNHFLEDCTKLYQHALMLMLFDVIYMVKIVWTEWTEFFSPHLCNGFNTFRHLKTFGHVFSRIDVVYCKSCSLLLAVLVKIMASQKCILDVWRRSKMLLHRCPHGSATRCRRWSATCQCWHLRDIKS